MPERKSPPKGYPKDKRQYAVPEKYMFPIDRKHIRAAIKLFGHHKWESEELKRKAARRIVNAARKYGIHVDPDSEVGRAAGLEKTTAYDNDQYGPVFEF
jgi:hypothetical protein